MDWLVNGQLTERNQLKDTVDMMTGQIQALRKMNEDQTRYCNYLRQQVVQLRVSNDDPASMGRIGWQVSAWIPQEVVDKMRAGENLNHPDHMSVRQWVEHIAHTLVIQAIKGIFRVNAKGNMTALVFEPLSLESNKRVLSCWFEGDEKRPGFIAPESQMEKLQRLQEGSEQHKQLFKQLLPSNENRPGH